jgi:hypothetical protein
MQKRFVAPENGFVGWPNVSSFREMMNGRSDLGRECGGPGR